MALNFLPFRFPGLPGVRCAFQTCPGTPGPVLADLRGEGEWTRGGNISLEVGDDPARATANREALILELGLAGLAETRQVHGVTTLFDPEPQLPEQTPSREADGMATARPGLGLLIKTADCQPILLAHRSGRYVAALHSGWKGNRQRYPAVGVAEFCRHYDVRPEDVLAVRGPSLSPAMAEFTNFDAEWGPDFLPWFRPATRTMDLWRLTRDQLVSAGLPAENIYSLDLCTLSMPEFFFSYRRNHNTGRQASIIWIEH